MMSADTGLAVTPTCHMPYLIYQKDLDLLVLVIMNAVRIVRFPQIF